MERWEPKPHRVIYDVSACFKEVHYRELLRKSGLVGIELEHTFEAAVIDEHNRWPTAGSWSGTQHMGEEYTFPQTNVRITHRGTEQASRMLSMPSLTGFAGWV